MSKNFYKGYRRIKVKPAGQRARSWWVQVRSENDKWLICERVNKYAETIDKGESSETIDVISKGAIVESHAADTDRMYGELFVITEPTTETP